MNTNLGQVELVRDINPGTRGEPEFTFLAGSFPSELIALGDRLYFSANNDDLGRELWVSDGTGEGTELLLDINQTDINGFASGSDVRNTFVFGDQLYFTADDGINGAELWISDGTSEGTELLRDINSSSGNAGSYGNSFPEDLIEFGGRLYFTANDGENGRELWSTDGTVAGTVLVVDINPGITNGYFDPFEPTPDSSDPDNLVILDERLYFTANDGASGEELWTSDGTVAGTILVADIRPGTDDPDYFYSRIGRSRPVENPQPFSSSPYNLIGFQGKLYFTADNGVDGNELWVSDGTAAGTQQLLDLNPGVNEFGNINSSSPGRFIPFNDKLYFSAGNSETGRELWMTDGTVKGTKIVKDINPNLATDANSFVQASSFPNRFIEFQDKLYFTADDGVTGNELWVTDGTTEGTQLVKDINANIFDNGYLYLPEGSGILGFTEFNNRLYFAADDGVNGREVWATDGTTEGTQLVADIYPGLSDAGYANNSFPLNFTVVGDELFFSANNGETGAELFKLTVDDFNSEPDLVTTDSTSTSSAEANENVNSISSSSSSSSSSSGSESSSSNSSNSVFNIAGSVSMIGGDGGDRLTGNSGDDLLDGNLGHDTLAGGLGADTFVLRAGDGTDTITDFELGIDRLGLADGLQFEDLSFSGHTISLGDEVLANLNGIDTDSLSMSNFEII